MKPTMRLLACECTLKKVPGTTFLTLPKKRCPVDVDILLVILMIKFMFSEVVLCSIEKDKFVNALHKFWFTILWIKLSINSEPKVFQFNLEKITVQPSMVNQCWYMEVNLKTVL